MSRFPYGVPLPNGLGTDPSLPADAPTIGFKLNHLCLRVQDLDKSLHFYINLMGMRTVFVTNTGPMTVYFLGYPSTDRHREHLDEFGKETPIPDTLGLLELFYMHGAEKQPAGFYSSGNTPPNLGFCHLGFSVPDLPKALKRLKESGVPIIKDIGVSTRQSIPITDWENEQGIGIEVEGTESEIHPVFKQIFANFAYVQDPVSYHRQENQIGQKGPC
ncbi:lactoylglutathione lyase [Rhinocladiella mackenziei CBS 650.93]|uniref:Rhinocladiella mackenziei CBS 650.93 unplaced genomic scaffold supercont1.11, whole genome shotgun sequence n=1 Tax=Rhinocladiella mackenziei CBS 650.93 TaxID=1442369 RepID=A0A0D2GMZ8_9EURO|nr:lactoylglutathione lyase [Rhinocladiella mackenziei CBS 650.93]KIW99747.1 lactoylglutathione lyase [Rhinocladiella mackenziei CBS 650.93]